MQAVNDSDVDKMFLLLQDELKKNSRKERMDTDIPYHGAGFLIHLPLGFEEAGIDKASAIFYSKNRPDKLFVQSDGHAGITLQPIGGKHDLPGEDFECMKDEISRILKRTDRKTVFYEEGTADGSIPVLWFDYKSFAANEPVYNLMFLFLSGEMVIMGTFYCIFRDYDRWKPVILDMLRTIHSEEAGNERV